MYIYAQAALQELRAFVVTTLLQVVFRKPESYAALKWWWWSFPIPSKE